MNQDLSLFRIIVAAEYRPSPRRAVGCAARLLREIAKDAPVMGIEDHPDFPKFNTVSTGLRDAEDRLLQALKGGKKADIVSAKVDLMGALDEYSKVADGMFKDSS